MGHARALRYAAPVALALILSGCQGLNDKQRDEAEAIASDVATDAIADSDRIDALEARIEELENDRAP